MNNPSPPPQGTTPVLSVEGEWQDISSAPRDGTLFMGCNLDQPTFGSWPMYRRVKHEFVNGELQTTDLGAWIILHDVEPDYQEGYTVGPDPEYAIAADDLNKSVRYGWMPLPKPPLTGGAETHSAVALCEDCPAVGYPTDKTRCTPCPRRYLSGEG